jgi:hypothetical protein
MDYALVVQKKKQVIGLFWDTVYRHVTEWHMTPISRAGHQQQVC